jgi:uncharacterized membrane protein
MFQGLINDAKTAVGSVVAKYLARASVAVPFVIAFGFATAAITFTLVERFGAIIGYWIVAGGFTLIGLIATLVVTVKEQEEEVAEKQAEATDTANVATDAAAQAAAQMPLALLGAVLSTPMGPSTLTGGAKLVARNIPLIGRRYRHADYVPPAPVLDPGLENLPQRSCLRTSIST